MKNTTEKLCERIRSERLRCNMTQARLAEGIVSRNMLSMIESGRTLPSTETLNELANRLDIPVGMLFAADDATETLYTKITSVTKAKALFKECRYTECADICSSVHFDDEMTALMAECHLKEAENNMKNCMLSSAASHLNKALDISKNTVYLDDSFKGTVKTYLFMINCAADSIDPDKLAKLFKIPSRIEPSKLMFLSLLSRLDRGDYNECDNLTQISSFLTKEHLTYLKANKLIREFSFTKALDLLHRLDENSEIDFITKYRVYADIELCYENKRDYESAYKYSTLKHHTLECFRN